MTLTELVFNCAERREAPHAAAAARTRALDQFLRGVEARALRMAEFSVRERADALDIVQDAMLSFAKTYGAHSDGEWPPLFYRVLNAKIIDFSRRERVRRGWRSWRSLDALDETADARLTDLAEPGPARRLAGEALSAALIDALGRLPDRQRQTFLLRLWEGLSVSDTALAMGVSEGSVKTHLHRALHALREALVEHR